MDLHRDTWPALAKLGWPVSLTLMVRVTMRTADILVVGITVGAAGVAALGIGDAAARIVLMTALGLGAGTIATVSQRIGAGRHDEADVAINQTAVLAVLVGVPFTVVGWLVAPGYFSLLGAEPEVVELGVLYLRIIILSAVPRVLAIMLTRAFQGAGDTVTPLVIRSFGTGLNILLTVLLVPGLGPFPELGLRGAAYGTVAGNVASALILVTVLTIGRTRIGFRHDGWWAPDTLLRIVRIGAPQVLERNLFAVGAIPLNAIVLTFGTAANAGFQVGRRVMLYALLPSRGVATASSTYMGNRVGALRADDGERYVRGGISLAALVSVVIALPLLVFAEPIAGIFVREPDALSFAAAWVRVYAVVTVLRAVYGVLRGGMQGAGDTRSPLVSTAAGIGLVAIGGSWLFGVALGWGILAVYVAIAIDPAVRVAMLYRWFDRGRWRRFLGEAPTPVAAESGPIPVSAGKEEAE
ncbi:MAG: MATE family efflux transporter [Nitriliruptorales bacterium]|nr:MATE family efflux transporter [Nitriliruptorales bacterium]